VLGLLIVAVALGIGLFLWTSDGMFRAHILRLRHQMAASQLNSIAGTTDLPEMVRAYAIWAGGEIGGPANFHARHEATLATTKGARPISLTAEQWTGTIASGIIWSARGSMSGMPVSIVDAYVDGRGELSARLFGSLQVAGGQGPDYDKGELMRYLSELPVYPDAILNNTALRWRQLDESSVEVTAHSRSGPASVRFYFDSAGDIVRMEADDRPMSTDDGATVPTAWHGLFGSFREFGRYRIPAYGEVGWVLPEGLFTYWHGTVVDYGPGP
jgi:hypothetical protein